MRAFVRDLMDRMDDKGVTQAALAEKIGTSPTYISKVMRGDANFTLETMTKLAMAVDGRINVCIVDGSPMAGAIDTNRPSKMAPPARLRKRVGASQAPARRASPHPNPLPLPRKRG